MTDNQLPKVLYVDDDLGLRLAIKLLLSDEPVNFFHVGDVTTARQIIAENPDLKLIIVDLHLGIGCNSNELVAELLASGIEALIYRYTSDPESVPAAVRGDRVLNKSRDELHETICEVIKSFEAAEPDSSNISNPAHNLEM